ncbi:hypothetical protein IT568_04065 [bacterium]|nr:hypothetical protein [bacterium]
MIKIAKIKENSILSNFIEDTCCENEIGVTFDEKISPDSYVIIKVDKYYNSLKLEKTPASVDCLIFRKCMETGYGLTLVELKNIKTLRNIDTQNIKEKFEITLSDFIKQKFKELFDTDYSEIKLFFVLNIELYKRDLGLKAEALIGMRFNFNNKKLMINLTMPNPTIKNCYTKTF